MRHNKELQEDFKKHGEAEFEFEKIDTLELKDDINYDYTRDLETLEGMWLEKIQPYGEIGYNSKKIER